MISKSCGSVAKPGNSDIWTLDQSVEFYQGTFRIDEELGFAGRVTHETHRNRSLFTPFAAKYILEKVPK